MESERGLSALGIFDPPLKSVWIFFADPVYAYRDRKRKQRSNKKGLVPACNNNRRQKDRR